MPIRLRDRQGCDGQAGNVGVRRVFGPGAVWFAVLLFSGCWSAKPPVTQPAANDAEEIAEGIDFQFVDVTADSGVLSVYLNGEDAGELAIVESLGGGVGMFDYDRDGRLDLLFPQGGTIERSKPLKGLPSSLWHNIGRGRFDRVTDASGVGKPRFYSHGCAMADFDNDGFSDIVITGYSALQLFRNQGDGTFTEITPLAQMNDSAWSSSAAWADFNHDGHLDLYVAHYVDWSWQNHPPCLASVPGKNDVCAPIDFAGLPDVIYFNKGDGTFTPAAAEVGLRSDGKGLGVLAIDLNLDSYCDIYVANDTTNNFLYVNQGDGRFRETGMLSGVAVDGEGASNGSMGIATLDFDQNLLPDLWVANFENETFALYENQGNDSFLYASSQAGVHALGTLYVGFGTVAADWDCDGDQDVVVANGHVMLHPASAKVAQAPLLLSNQSSGNGTRASHRLQRHLFDDESYFSQDWRGRGVASGDLDNDGRLDLVFTNTGEPAHVLRNTTPVSGTSLNVELVGTRCNRDAIGATVILETDKRKLLRSVCGGGSYLSQGPYSVHFGIPAGDQAVRLIIRWPGGSETVVAAPAGESVAVIEPSSSAATHD